MSVNKLTIICVYGDNEDVIASVNTIEEAYTMISYMEEADDLLGLQGGMYMIKPYKIEDIK